MSALNLRELGDFIRDQRRGAQISLRQLAKQAGVSNPYLSQIERGLRKPSAEILQQIAKALRISAEVLYVQAGILEEREGGESIMAAVLGDEHLTERQKQVIIDIYDAFRRENTVAASLAIDPDAGVGVEAVAQANGVRLRPSAADLTPAAEASKETPAPRRGDGRRTTSTTNASRNGAAKSASTSRTKAGTARKRATDAEPIGTDVHTDFANTAEGPAEPRGSNG